MPAIRRRSEEIRRFLLESVAERRADAVARAAAKFGLSRQALSRHVQALIREGQLEGTGRTRRRAYRLAVLSTATKFFAIPGLAEDVVWRRDIAPLLGVLAENVLDIWHYGFTEMVNNVVDHSGGSRLRVSVRRTAVTTEMGIVDDGIGIFRKIRDELGLEDERHAILELAKGKLTTDPEHHTGEGIFFASRMFDDFAILSGEVHFSHRIDDESDWILERDVPGEGTAVHMTLRNSSGRTLKSVFDRYTSKDGEYGFTRTVVPVRLLRHGVEKLLSRSQAKRLLARFDRFETVILDFTGVDLIGQAFADEVFRVFPQSHPRVKLSVANAGSEVKAMIRRARQGGRLFD